MTLDTLLSGVEVQAIYGASNTPVARLVCDSRRVQAGDVFVAIRGFQSDGHDYLENTARSGAGTVVVDSASGISPDALQALRESHPHLVVVVVKDSRRSLALMADTFHYSPSRKLKLVGITGTNGKTTTTYLIRSILEAHGERVGLLGTIGYEICGEHLAAPNTTPDSLELTRLLARMVERGATHAVMEVSSHALTLGRVEGCRFDAAVFTNLTQDHLDFHGSMDEYLTAKTSLFAMLDRQACAVVNIDDPYGTEFVGMSEAPVITYGLSADAQVSATGLKMDASGISFSAVTPRGTFPVTSPLSGQYNVYNLLAAIAYATGRGIPQTAIIRGLGAMRQIPGRFERVAGGGGVTVIVDYAHTPDALERVLDAAREITEGRLLVVFGCGGDRDRGKRPLMGEAAGRLADRVYVTSDNPRSEDPISIIGQIVPGVEQGIAKTGGQGGFAVVPDRQSAIFAAVGEMQKGDVLVIAGKGHEDYQIVGDRRFHFDDRETAAEALKVRSTETGVEGGR